MAPRDERGEDTWVRTQVTVRASSEASPVFLKDYHASATQGRATLFDDVRMLDLSP